MRTPRSYRECSLKDYDWAFNGDEELRQRLIDMIPAEASVVFCHPESGVGKTHLAVGYAWSLARSMGASFEFHYADNFAKSLAMTGISYDETIGQLRDVRILLIDELGRDDPRYQRDLEMILRWQLDDCGVIVGASPLPASELMARYDGSIFRRILDTGGGVIDLPGVKRKVWSPLVEAVEKVNGKMES